MKLKQRILTFYIFFVFALAALLVVIPTVLVYRLLWPHNERRRFQFHGFLCRFFVWCTRHIPGVSFETINPYGEDFSRPAVIICNHQSHLDLLTILSLSPRILAMTNQWVWRFPLYAPVIRYCEFYPVSNGLEINEEKIKSLIRRGYSVLIFPEGTRSATCEILKFHRGAFYMAERIGADILPLYLDGPGRVLPKTDLLLHPGTITLVIGQRIASGDLSMGANYREKTRAWHRHYLTWQQGKSCR